VATDNLYSEHAETIESVLAYIRRAHRLSADDGDEFASWSRLRLLENDCAILRKFQGLSSFKTFLVTVLQRLFLDWRIKEWGKWRPTADARRLGPVAIELERLVLRDDMEFEQAVQVLLSKGTAQSSGECDEIWGQLKQRPRRQRASSDELADLPAPPRDVVEEEQRRVRAVAVVAALRKAIAALPPGDQLIVKLRFADRFTVARIAKLIDSEQKPLYRRYEQLWKQLRASMQACGVSEQDVRDLFGEGFMEDFAPRERNTGAGPSHLSDAGGVRA
jgi:RNA polymerase sigma factor (sigma-70 family)